MRLIFICVSDKLPLRQPSMASHSHRHKFYNSLGAGWGAWGSSDAAGWPYESRALSPSEIGFFRLYIQVTNFL